MSAYFAFGSNANTEFLHRWLESHDVDGEGLSEPQHALLRGFRFRTNYSSVAHHAGAANIERSPQDHVEGVLYEITPSVRTALRQKEGWPRRYEEIEVIVEVVSSGKTVTALTYIVAPDRRLDHDLPVSTKYRRLIIDAAEKHRFSPAYQRFLRQFLKTSHVAVAPQI